MKRFLFIVVTLILFTTLGVLTKQTFKLNKKVRQMGSKVIESNERIFRLENFLYLPLNETLVSYLKVYDVRDENGSLELIRHGKDNDGGYIVATKSFTEAEALLGYGIADDNSFEDDFSLKYNKPSFGFDCGVSESKGKSEKFTFVRECIASDQFIYQNYNSNQNVNSFSNQINKLKLENKKLFVKMDIEGAEYEAFTDIFKYSKNITGIALEIHLSDGVSRQKAVDLLKKLSDDFILIHVHGNNCCKPSFTTINSLGAIPDVLELSFINKFLTTNATLSENQSHPLKIDQPNVLDRPDVHFKVLTKPSS